MDLPEDFVRRGLEMAKGSFLFGKPFEEMTRDELIAAAAQGWNAERKLLDEHAAEVNERAEWYIDKLRSRYGLRI